MTDDDFRTFDATTGAPGGQHAAPPEPDGDPAWPGMPSPLDDLREASAELVDHKPYVFTNPRGRIRLTCRTSIDFRENRKWQIAALPPAERRKGQPAVSRLNNVYMMSRVIADTCVLVEVLAKGTTDQWRVITGPDNLPLTFSDHDLLSVLGAMDPVAAVKAAMNGSEPDILRRGTEILQAADWIDKDDDEGVDGDDDDPM